jgi:hypothetical protein
MIRASPPTNEKSPAVSSGVGSRISTHQQVLQHGYPIVRAAQAATRPFSVLRLRCRVYAVAARDKLLSAVQFWPRARCGYQGFPARSQLAEVAVKRRRRSGERSRRELSSFRRRVKRAAVDAGRKGWLTVEQTTFVIRRLGLLKV